MPLFALLLSSITAVNILMSWALYLPYRVTHLHFITIANMMISGYLAGYLVLHVHVSFVWALLLGLAEIIHHSL